MPNINNLMPSNYIKTSDLGGMAVLLTMSHVAVEDVGDGQHKPVLYFMDAMQHLGMPQDKGLIVNVTNKNTVVELFGPETEAWRGQKIVVYPDRTSFKGTMTDCIRMRAPKPQAQAAPIGNPALETAPPAEPASMHGEQPPSAGTDEPPY